MPALLRALVFASGLILGTGNVWSAEVQPHLVGMARSLISQIDEAQFAATGDPDLGEQVNDIIRETRLRSWAGKPPRIAVDRAALAQGLGLDLANDEHRQTLEAVLAASDPAARSEAIASAAKLSRAARAGDAAAEDFDAALATALGTMQRRARIESASGKTIDIEWDPDTASVLLRMKVGEDEVILHGGTPATLVDGELAFTVAPDKAPITRLTPDEQAAISADVFGVWSGSDGAQWMIRGGGEIEAIARARPDPIAQAAADLDRARERLRVLEKEKVYIWVEPGGGEVIQKKFKRLPSPFRYDRERSENANRDEIEALRARIAVAEGELKLPPVRQYDPMRLRNGDGGRAVAIDVVETGGRTHSFDQAAFDGARLTASRTLRAAADITDLPDWVISGLIKSWSPPEWVELEAKYNPRARTVHLEGLRWRLNVTYDPQYQDISSIHTPYSEPLVLRRVDDDVMLRIIGLDGAVPDIIRHDHPYRLEARFNKPRQGELQAVLRREGGDAAIALMPATEESESSIYRSGILYARSVQFATRQDPDGLFIRERFVEEERFEDQFSEWRKTTRESEGVATDLFRGNWRVAHVAAEGGARLTGVAQVNAAGTSARLALNGDTQLYQSLDMRALRGTSPDPDFLEIIFERVMTFGAEPSTAAPPPLPKGEIIYFPTGARSIEAELEGATASTGLDLKPVPDETIRLLLKSRASGHLAGGWHEIRAGGEYGPGGQQTWVRGIEITGAVAIEDQTRRTAPTQAFYPWGPKASSGSSSERTVFVFGKHLPTSHGDAMVFESLTPGVTYDNPRLPSEMSSAQVALAWQLAAEVPRASGANKDEDEVGVFVTARFDRDSEPGPKILTLNDAPGIWLLDFADARGRAYFVDTPPTDGVPSDIFKSSDSAFLELELEAPIPYKPPLVFTITRDGKTVGEIPLEKATGEAAFGREGRFYRSPPLHFYRSDKEGWAPPDEVGAIKFDVAPPAGQPEPKDDNKFEATWTEPLRLAVPLPATMRIIDEDDDEMSEIWRKALERAAACYGGKVKIDPRATSQENSHFILTELVSFRGPFKKANIAIGDHAAAILIRDEFLRFSAALAQSYTDTAAYDTELDKFIEAGVASEGASDPLWKVMSTADSKFSAEQMLDIGILAEVRQTDRDEAVSFRRDQLRNMLKAYVRAVQTSNQRAKDAGDCKVDELLVIAGQRVPMIVERILPRLVLRREQEGRTFFEPDVVARAYVRSLYVKGEEVRALSEYAAIDDTYKALALAAVGGGVAMLASRLGYLGAAAYATVTADAIDVAYFGTKGVLDYQKSEEFYEFAKGASAAYGSAFLEDAAAQRQSALGAAAGVLLPGAGVAWGTLGDLRHLAKTGRGAEIARRLGSVDAAGLARLSDAERLDLLAYVDDVRRTGQLAKAKGAWDKTKAVFTSTGRKLDSADTDFLNSFDAYSANAKARIDRGREIASRLDTFDGDALKPLSAAERADVAAYAENVKFRENALASGDFGSRVAVPSAREVEFAGKFDDMARAADGVNPPAAGDAADAAAQTFLPPSAGPTPGIAVDGVPASAAGGETASSKSADFASATDPALKSSPYVTPAPAPVGTAPPYSSEVLSPPVRPDANSPRGPPAETSGPAVVAAPGPSSSPTYGVAHNQAADAPLRPYTDVAPQTPTPSMAADDVPTRTDMPVAEHLDPNATRDFPPDFRSPLPAQPNAVARASEPRSPVPEQFHWGPPLKQDSVIPLRGDNGSDPAIVIDRHLNNGSSNSAYKLKSIPGESGDWVARISKGAPESLANRVDQEGWRALDAVKGEDVLVPARKGPFEVDGAAVGRTDVDRVRLEVVELVPYRASEQIPEGGVPTAGQAIALDRAKRAFNAKGYVWLDNHPGNYGFKPRDPANLAADEWQVVIIDPGGIVKVVDDAGDAAGIARRMQTRLENPNPDIERYLRNARASGAGAMQNTWSEAAKVDLLDEYGKHIDLSQLGIDTPRHIGFRTDGMVFYPNVRALSKIEGDPSALESAYQALRAQSRGPAATAGSAANAGDTAKLTSPDLPTGAMDSGSGSGIQPPRSMDGPAPAHPGAKHVGDTAAPHPPPDPEETILLDMELVSAELKDSAQFKADPEKTINEAFDSNKTAYDPPPAADHLGKTENFPPPDDIDPANQARGPPVRTAAQYDASNLSEKLDTSPNYKFSKPAPDIRSVPSGKHVFGGKPVEFPTGDIVNGVQKTRRIPGDTIVSPADGSVVQLGKLLGQGAGASVFADKGNPSQVIRVSEISADEKANKMLHYDLVGRRVGEAIQNADGNGFFRLTRTNGQFVVTDNAAGTRYLVTLEENLAHSGGSFTNASDRFAARPPNSAQELTKALAIREMNRRGVIWTDHKLKNFDIVENLNTPTGYQMLIFDTGGIRPVKGEFVYERARNAEALQRIFDHSPASTGKKLPPAFVIRVYDSVKFMDNRVMGNALEDWMPVFSPNQINRPDNYYHYSIMPAEALEDFAAETLNKDIRLPSLR
jgi:hypothetical protein